VPRGNPSPKLAITVDPDVHERVVAAAQADEVSVSAWMTEAARRALTVRDGLAAVAEWEAEAGPLTDDELAAAHRRVADELAASTPRSSSTGSHATPGASSPPKRSTPGRASKPKAAAKATPRSRRRTP